MRFCIGKNGLRIAIVGLTSCCPSQPPAAVAPSAPAAEAFHAPNYAKPCARTSDLATLMETELNNKLTEVSQMLFHDDRSDWERMPAIADAMGVILGCIPQLRALAPPGDSREQAQFTYEIAMLRGNALAVQDAALEMNDDAAHHWFLHLKQSCSSCHAQFRQEEPQEEPGQVIEVK